MFDTAVRQVQVAATVRRVPRGLVVAVRRASALAILLRHQRWCERFGLAGKHAVGERLTQS